MAIHQLIKRESILEHDLEALVPRLDGIAELISQNPFSERIKLLLANPGWATKPVKNMMGELSAPNCLGTAFFIAGVGKFNYPYHAYDNELDEHMKQPGPKRWDDIFLPHYERRIPGAFVFSCDFNADWHAGIYLGTIEDEHILFAQHGHGREFGPETLRNYSNPSYYIPRTLRTDQQ